MNKVILMGRMTKDPDMKQTGTGKSVCQFTIACDRRYKVNGERQADFINCVAWEKNADVIGNYFHKGSRIAVVGSLQSRSYDDQNGQKRYVTEVIVDEIEFVDTKAEAGQQAQAQQNAQENVQYEQPQQPAPNPTPIQTAPTQLAQPVGFEPVEVFSADEGALPFDIEPNVGF